MGPNIGELFEVLLVVLYTVLLAESLQCIIQLSEDEPSDDSMHAEFRRLVVLHTANEANEVRLIFHILSVFAQGIMLQYTQPLSIGRPINIFAFQAYLTPWFFYSTCSRCGAYGTDEPTLFVTQARRAPHLYYRRQLRANQQRFHLQGIRRSTGSSRPCRTTHCTVPPGTCPSARHGPVGRMLLRHPYPGIGQSYRISLSTPTVTGGEERPRTALIGRTSW